MSAKYENSGIAWKKMFLKALSLQYHVFGLSSHGCFASGAHLAIYSF